VRSQLRTTEIQPFSVASCDFGFFSPEIIKKALEGQNDDGSGGADSQQSAEWREVQDGHGQDIVALLGGAAFVGLVLAPHPGVFLDVHLKAVNGAALVNPSQP
jgi:hypothetical protein